MGESLYHNDTKVWKNSRGKYIPNDTECAEVLTLTTPQAREGECESSYTAEAFLSATQNRLVQR